MSLARDIENWTTDGNCDACEVETHVLISLIIDGGVFTCPACGAVTSFSDSHFDRARADAAWFRKEALKDIARLIP